MIASIFGMPEYGEEQLKVILKLALAAHSTRFTQASHSKCNTSALSLCCDVDIWFQSVASPETFPAHDM